MASIRPAMRAATRARIGAVAIGLFVSLAAASANAEPGDPVALADAAFKEAQRLRAAGNDAAACPKFAESKRLAPAVGVSLYLADCYAKTGRSASAWKEFRDAEKMARERGDKRADVAAQRAAALSPNLSRLTVEAPADDAKTGEQLTLDGASLPPESWNVALPVDPGDHLVTVASPGQPTRTLSVHVEGGGASTTLPTGLASAPAAPAFVPVPAAAPESAPPTGSAPSQAPAAVVSPVSEPLPAGSRQGATARWIAGGLMVAGAVGIGLGTYLVTHKTEDMAGGQSCEPHLQPHAIPEGVVAFSVGGAALLSGAILFYVNRPGRTEVSLAPSIGPGIGGAVLRGSF